MTVQTTAAMLRPACMADLPAVVDIANACARETDGRDELTLERYTEEWRDPALNLDTNTRVAVLPDGTIAGCVEVWSSAPYVDHWLWGRVHPSLRGQGIGTALMDWAEARVAEYVEQAPPEAQVTLTTASASGHQPTIDLMIDRGFVAIRHSLQMERSLAGELPTPAWPAGVALRPFTSEQHLALYRAIDEIWHDHWGYVETPEDEGYALWLHRMTQAQDYDPSLWFVAYAGGEIAGAVLCYPAHSGDTSLGWVSRLGVRRPWRKQRLAQALLYHAFGELQRRGCTRVGLGVDAESLTGATRLYKKVGLQPVQSSVTFSKIVRSGAALTTEALSD